MYSDKFNFIGTVTHTFTPGNLDDAGLPRATGYGAAAYRRVMPPGTAYPRQWQWLYEGRWHPLLNSVLIDKLDALAAQSPKGR